jgi:S-adenosylmethionine/arginine decarboxylase-like enzyme
MKKPLHKHLLLRGLVKNPVYDEQTTELWLTEFVDSIGMKIIKGPFASYVEVEGNRGLTATVMIETSHIAFHIWDEKDPGLLQFDLYTCSELNVPSVLQKLELFFQFETYEYLVFDREETFVLIDGSFLINASKE